LPSNAQYRLQAGREGRGGQGKREGLVTAGLVSCFAPAISSHLRQTGSSNTDIPVLASS